MTFNHSTFATALDGYSGISISKSWYQWGGTTGSLNTVMDYDKGDYGYRTWYQETSSMKENSGMLVSCKIDFKRTTGDDHIIILTGFQATSNGPQMVFAQASVQFHGDEDDNIIGTPVTSGDMGQGIYDTLNAQIQGKDFGGGVDSTADGRHTLPDIARANINSILQAVS
ncbi:MAG: hypothetical protein ACK4NY_20700 [Spirosomataceae bacterium]